MNKLTVTIGLTDAQLRLFARLLNNTPAQVEVTKPTSKEQVVGTVQRLHKYLKK